MRHLGVDSAESAHSYNDCSSSILLDENIVAVEAGRSDGGANVVSDRGCSGHPPIDDR